MAKRVCCEVTHQGATLVRSHDVCGCLFSRTFILYNYQSCTPASAHAMHLHGSHWSVLSNCHPVWIHKHAL